MELSLKSFKTTFSLSLEKFSPLKQKYLRYTNSPIMNRTLREAIMTRSKLNRRYNLDRTTINFANSKKQGKKQYFSNIGVKNVTDNKKFWKTVRSKFSNKCKTANTIILVENE